MLSPQTASMMLDGTSTEPTGSKQDALEAIAVLYIHTVDTLKGFAKMIEKAESQFLPVVQRFHNLHSRHADALAMKLHAMGYPVDTDGSLMGTVNEAVIGLRAFFDDIDEDVMNSVRSGESHVLKSFDDVLACDLQQGDKADVKTMRDELSALLDETRQLGST